MLVTGAINGWVAAFAPILALLAGGGIFAAIKANHGCIQEGELGAKKLFGRALRRRLGRKDGSRFRLKIYKGSKEKRRPIKVYRPGRGAFTVPLFLKLVRIKVRQDSRELEVSTFTLSDWTVFTCGSTVHFFIREDPESLEKALFGTTDLINVVKNRAIAIRTRTLVSISASDLVGDGLTRTIGRLTSSLQQEAREWGVEVKSFDLTGNAPDSLTAIRLQVPKLVKVSTKAVLRAAETLGLADNKEVLPLLAAGLLPSSSAVVLGTASHQHLNNGHVNGSGLIEVLDGISPNGGEPPG